MSKIDDLNLAAEREAFAQHLNALSNPQLPALLQSVSAKYKTKPTLQPGSKGPAVIELQGLLIQVQPLIGDKTPISPDGDYGVKTATVVKAVQAKSGLSQTGVADAPTWVATVKIIERSGRKPLVSGQQAASAAHSPSPGACHHGSGSSFIWPKICLTKHSDTNNAGFARVGNAHPAFILEKAVSHR